MHYRVFASLIKVEKAHEILAEQKEHATKSFSAFYDAQSIT